MRSRFLSEVVGAGVRRGGAGDNRPGRTRGTPRGRRAPAAGRGAGRPDRRCRSRRRMRRGSTCARTPRAEVLRRVRASRRGLAADRGPGLPKGDRGELAVEMMTEAGVDVIVPWAAARCVTQWKGERAVKALGRWRSTAREAAKQARRFHLPEVTDPAGTARVAELLAAAGARRWCCTRRPPSRCQRPALPARRGTSSSWSGPRAASPTRRSAGFARRAPSRSARADGAAHLDGGGRGGGRGAGPLRPLVSRSTCGGAEFAEVSVAVGVGGRCATAAEAAAASDGAFAWAAGWQVV